MARIAVLGATGLTGQELVAQALAAGHEVTALVRRPAALPLQDERLRVVVGDATDADVIAEVARDQDGLVSSLGRPESGTSKATIDDSLDVDVCAASARYLLALAEAGRSTRRALFMSTHGAGTSNDGSPYVVQLRDWVGRRVADKDDMEAALAGSGSPLVWTVVQPLIYRGARGSGARVFRAIELDETSKVTYADLAAFALDELLAVRFPRTFLTITEPLTGAAAAHPAVPAVPDEQAS